MSSLVFRASEEECVNVVGDEGSSKDQLYCRMEDPNVNDHQYRVNLEYSRSIPTTKSRNGGYTEDTSEDRVDREGDECGFKPSIEKSAVSPGFDQHKFPDRRISSQVKSETEAEGEGSGSHGETVIIPYPHGYCQADDLNDD